MFVESFHLDDMEGHRTRYVRTLAHAAKAPKGPKIRSRMVPFNLVFAWVVLHAVIWVMDAVVLAK